MAFQSNGPVMLALPPFRGFTRKIVLVAGCSWLVELLLVSVAGRYSPKLAYLVLQPATLAHGFAWQAVTYPMVLVGMGLLSLLFALFTIWIFGSQVEADRGSRWLAEYFFAVTIGGAVLATAVSYAVGRHVNQLNPENPIGAGGLWPAVLGMVVAFAYLYGDAPIRMYFVLNMKAKYVAAVYLGFYLLELLFGGDKFGAVVALANALCGWIFLKAVPRRGLQYAVSEKWYGMRNTFYRNKRKRAAKEFEVYMRKQGKDVRVDDSSDSTDKKWMN